MKILEKQNLIKNAIIVLLFFIVSANHLFAQNAVSGKDFYVAFARNDIITVPSQGAIELNLRITTSAESVITLSFTEDHTLDVTFTVPANSIYDYILDVPQMLASYSPDGPADRFKKKSIKVSATEPISLVAVNTVNPYLDAALVAPLDAWGKEYYHFGLSPYDLGGKVDNYNGFLLIAKEDNTRVVINYALPTPVNADFVLNEGETYHFYSARNNPAGTRIVADKPIAHFQNASLVSTDVDGSTRSSCNFEQIAPVSQWGSRFVLTTGYWYGTLTNSASGEVTGAHARIFANDFPTNVTVTHTNGDTETFTINADSQNKWKDVRINKNNHSSSKACYITSDKPVGISTYLSIASLPQYGGQPSQAWLPPLEQKTRNVLVSPLKFLKETAGELHHYCTVIVPTASRNSTTISVDGEAPIPVSLLNNDVFQWAADNVGGSEHSFGRYYFGANSTANIILKKTAMFDNPDGLIVLAYGMNITGNTYFYCAGASYRDLTAGFTVNGVNYADVDGKAFCTSDFVLKAYPDNLSLPITWRLNDEEIPNTMNERTVNLNNLPDGQYLISMTAPERPVYTTRIFVGGGPAIWTPQAKNESDRHNWNNIENWTPAVIPTSCSNVYIPGNLAYYPQLSDASPGECNKIYFMQGAELGRPDKLTYNQAYVQLNFGLKQSKQQKNDNRFLILESAKTADRLKYAAAVSTPLDRERWYMLSSPLRGAVSGDLGFGGFPLTFLQKFGPIVKDGTPYVVGTWTTPYTSMVEPLSLTEGFAFYMYGYGSDDNEGCEESGVYCSLLNEAEHLPANLSGKDYGLKTANGIIELPFFADTTNLYAHRTQVYDSGSKESTFYYVCDGSSANSAGFNSLTGKYDPPHLREDNNGSYRFAPEIRNGASWTFQNPVYHSGTGLVGEDFFLVGNPYMSSLDMAAFLNDEYNEANVQSNFRLWGGDTDGFISYILLLDNSFMSTKWDDINEGYVAPMQSFVLQTRGGYTPKTNVVQLNVEKISTTRPAGMPSLLRSSAVEENILRIKAESNAAASWMLIGNRDNVSNGFNENKDVKKLFAPYSYAPELYAIAGDIPADIHFINNDGEVNVPLGIKTGNAGEIKLTFTGMDNYTKAAKIELIDAKENRTIDLTGKASYTYTFNQTATGVQNGRFSIRFGKSLTALSEVNNPDDLKVYGDSQGIYVVSSSLDPVQRVIVYDFQGRKVYESASDAGYYPLHGNTGSLPLIVKVMTKNQVKTVKL